MDELIISKTDCALGIQGICTSCDMMKRMKKFRKEIMKKTDNIPDEAIVRDIMSYLNVASEYEILNHPDIKRFINDPGEIIVEKITRYKTIGPANSTELLDNNVIDLTLHQMTRECFLKDGEFSHFNGVSFTGELRSIKIDQKSVEYDGERTMFYPVPFQMIDFYDVGSELATLDVVDIFERKFNTIGMVLNTDVSTGRGIHWFALFIDGREDVVSLEYFNSSGENPPKVILKRMAEIKRDLLKSGRKAVIRSATFNQIQKSRTECGVWSLVYIYSRIKKRPVNWLNDVNASDADMYKARKKLFLDG